MNEQAITTSSGKIPQEPASARRLDELGWALFLLALGVILFVPGTLLPPETWLVVAGAVLLGVEVARRFAGYTLRPLAVVVGLLALAAGLQGILSLDFRLFPILLLSAGAYILLKPMFGRTRNS